MQSPEEFRQQAHQLVDWMADYYASLEKYPVRSQVRPREIFDQLPQQAPEVGEGMDQIMADFERIIMPGITHWQHPSFHAYFPANGSYPSLLAEMLTATLGSQCMIWETSPAAAELEEMMMNWLGQMIGIPESWDGVIQATASEATLCAILSAREKYSDFQVNVRGVSEKDGFRVYGSAELHSSIEKGLKIAGLGQENYRKIAVDESFAMKPETLKEAIEADIAQGLTPLCVVVAIGTTSSTGIDPLEPIADLCREYDIWLHVDAAYAGSALILEEYRWMINGIERADSFVFNPHKWLYTHFDCSAYFVKDKGTLIRTFEIMPEYLKTGVDAQVNNYRDWGIPLGRRFRALKLWFVLRNFGVKQLQENLREHMRMAQTLKQWVLDHPDFELLAPVPLNLVCFRYHPLNVNEESTLDTLNQELIFRLNASGEVYLTHTRLKGTYTLRLVAGGSHTGHKHIQKAWRLILEEIEKGMRD